MLESKNFENEEMLNNYKAILSNLVSRVVGDYEINEFAGDKWNWTTIVTKEKLYIKLSSQCSLNGKNDVNFRIDVTQFDENGHSVWGCPKVKIPHNASKRVLENRLSKVVLHK